MICAFKFVFEENVLAFFGLAIVLATFTPFLGKVPPNLLVTLQIMDPYLKNDHRMIARRFWKALQRFRFNSEIRQKF
jgi:hypothetical protein